MTIYIIILCACVFIMSFGEKSKYFSWALIFLLFFVLAFRNVSIGTDTYNYLNHYYFGYAVEGKISMKNIEFGYLFLISLLKKLQLTSSSVIISMSLITFLFIYLSCRKLKVNLSFAFSFFVLIGFYFFSFNGARQILAVSILLYAYTFLIQNQKQDKVYFILFTFLALSFHNSIIFFIPLLFVSGKVISNKLIWGGIIFSLFFFLLDMGFLNYVSLYLEIYYSSYSDLFSEGAATSLNAKLYYLMIFIVQMIILMYTKSKYSPKLVNLFILSIILFFLLKNMHPFLARLIYGLSIIQVIYYSLFFLDKNINLSHRILLFIMLVSLLFYGQYDVLQANIGELVPYKLNQILLP